MPEYFKVINAGDLRVDGANSYSNQAVNLGNGYVSFDWYGRVPLAAGVSYANAHILRYSDQKGKSPRSALIIPANSLITRIGIKHGALTMGGATDKIKISSAVNTSTSGLYLLSAAASSNALAAITSWIYQNNGDAAVSVGSSDLTLKLFATDGNGTVGSQAASTMTSTAAQDILVRICGIAPLAEVPDSAITVAPPTVTSNNYT
jgi:hypothetical protein